MNCGTERMILSLLVCGLCAPVPAVGAGVTITNVEVDGYAQVLPGGSAASGRDPNALRVPSTARSLRFQFAASETEEEPAVRLRYKLEGYDEAWHESSTRMRVLVLFSTQAVGLVGSHEFYLEGETPQWRVKLQDALFVRRQGTVVVPEGATLAGISFLSHGGEAGLGVMGVDGVRVLVERPDAARAEVFDLGLTEGTNLDQPSGSPANWTRAGSRLELAQLGIRATPARILSDSKSSWTPRSCVSWLKIMVAVSCPNRPAWRERTTVWRTCAGAWRKSVGSFSLPVDLAVGRAWSSVSP